MRLKKVWLQLGIASVTSPERAPRKRADGRWRAHSLLHRFFSLACGSPSLCARGMQPASAPDLPSSAISPPAAYLPAGTIFEAPEGAAPERDRKGELAFRAISYTPWPVSGGRGALVLCVWSSAASSTTRWCAPAVYLWKLCEVCNGQARAPNFWCVCTAGGGGGGGRAPPHRSGRRWRACPAHLCFWKGGLLLPLQLSPLPPLLLLPLPDRAEHVLTSACQEPAWLHFCSLPCLMASCRCARRGLAVPA